MLRWVLNKPRLHCVRIFLLLTSFHPIWTWTEAIAVDLPTRETSVAASVSSFRTRRSTGLDAASLHSDGVGNETSQSCTRHPPYYWSDLSNVQRELSDFWSHAMGTEVYEELRRRQQHQREAPPSIPNESMLNHWARHDLRYAIVLYGGRKALSQRLGGAKIISGVWKRAVQESPELQLLVRQGKHGLSTEYPPLSPAQKKRQKSNAKTGVAGNEPTSRRRWMHRPGRKPKGYWSLQTTVQELFDYLDECPTRHNRPPVWMPRPAEFSACGREDLQLAIRRFGGARKVCRMASLVPYPEWRYFDKQLQLLVGLRDYLDEYCHGDRTAFPSASAIQRDGYDALYRLVQQYGGRAFVANRLGLRHSVTRDNEDEAMNWGPFSIDFAVELLQFVREDQMQKRAPLRKPEIAIPTEKNLLANGRVRLHEQIEEFGGYENVARRLGLAFFDV